MIYIRTKQQFRELLIEDQYDVEELITGRYEYLAEHADVDLAVSRNDILEEVLSGSILSDYDDTDVKFHLNIQEMLDVLDNWV